MALKVNYKDDMFVGERKYRTTTNPDGTVSFTDVTTYSQTGDQFAGADINATNDAINDILDGTTKVPKASVADSATTATNATNATNAVNSANAGNADTVDGSHAWQMQTLNQSGATHGLSHQLVCQFNIDGSNKFKLKTEQGIQVKTDDSTLWNGIGLWIGTQVQYDAIPNKDGTVLYFIRG